MHKPYCLPCYAMGGQRPQCVMLHAAASQPRAYRQGAVDGVMVLVEHIEHQRLQGIRADQPMVGTQQAALIVTPGLDLHTHAGHIVHTGRPASPTLDQNSNLPEPFHSP